jgi:succinyl-CoA synthetase beta subunit
MDLLEYQAKELFRDIGIPVLPSQRIEHPKDLKGLAIAYPIVLKSQVHIGGRGRVGGVKFVENTIDAIAAAQTIFNLPIMGEYPNVLLAEAKYNVEREFYLAVTLNRSVRRPVLLGSQHGGVDVQAAIDKMHNVIVEQDFSPYYARRLALKMGLSGSLVESVSGVMAKMYHLFTQYDLDLIEINPLGISTSGEVMALDGKVIVNDDAIARHPNLVALMAKLGDPPTDLADHAPVITDPHGQIGIICNGAGLTMATLDLVCQAGGRPAGFFNIGGETCWDCTPEKQKARLQQAITLMAQHPSIRVVLVNLISNLIPCNEAIDVISRFAQQHPPALRPLSEFRPEIVSAQIPKTPQLVVRLVGAQCDRAMATLADSSIPLLNSLDEAVTQAVALAKPG